MMALLNIAFRRSNFNNLLIINKNKYFHTSSFAKKIILSQFMNTNSSISFSSSSLMNSQHENSQSKALVLISDLKELRSSPRPALTVGLLGLLPLALPPFYFIYEQTFASQFASGQLTYGAVVLSFLGGIQWGHTLLNQKSTNLDNWTNTGWSTVPCLVGWFSILMPLSVGLLSATMGHGLLLYRDMTMSIGTYPSWFRALRFIFSLVAIMALWTSCICFYAFHEKKSSKTIKK